MFSKADAKEMEKRMEKRAQAIDREENGEESGSHGEENGWEVLHNNCNFIRRNFIRLRLSSLSNYILPFKTSILNTNLHVDLFSLGRSHLIYI